MLQQIIDRRLSGKNKSIGNRERFLRRYREQIGEAVRRAVSGRGIRDLEQGEDITLPKRDVSEPVFGHGQGGDREYVHPGLEVCDGWRKLFFLIGLVRAAKLSQVVSQWVVTNPANCSRLLDSEGSEGVPGNSPHISAGILIANDNAIALAA
jgi:hypothetical protein